MFLLCTPSLAIGGDHRKGGDKKNGLHRADPLIRPSTPDLFIEQPRHQNKTEQNKTVKGLRAKPSDERFAGFGP